MTSSPAPPLALKVMRVSRPSIVTGASWQPALADTPAVFAHSAASPLSLQGPKPLQGIPTSLRDLTAVAPLLHLPTTFGLVQLGETFSCCISLSNEISIPIDGVKMQIEMHTAATKTPLQELGGSSEKIGALASMDTIVHFEIKELGQHTLACIVQYRTPHGESREFSKFYKFPVTNPLSVKTKVHVPQSATALMSPTEKDKVYLEVHIQNVTQDPMWFERLRFEPVEGLVAIDGNVYQPSGTQTPSSIFSGWSALMHPSDVRQYLYIISPTSPTPSWGAPAAGSVVPLGRLDISWRTTFGEPARLLTSVLTRRVPVAATPAIPSSPPLHSIPSVVQRALGGTIPRPASPASSIASGPPSRPGSPSASTVPYKPRVSSRSASPTRSAFTTSTAMIATVVNRLATARQFKDLSVDFTAEVLNRDAIQIGGSFSVDIKLVISTATLPMSGKLRRLKVAVQHTISSNPAGLRSGSSTRQGSVLPLNLPLFSPHTSNHGRVVMDSPHAQVQGSKQIGIALPSPYSFSSEIHPVPAYVSAVGPHARAATINSATSGGGGGGSLANRLAAALHPTPTTSFTGSVEFLGTSVINLAPILLHLEAGRWTGGGKVTLEYLATKEGLAIVGGLRLLLLVDEEVDELLVSTTSVEGGKIEAGGEAGGEARILNEWSAIGEVWVMS